MAAVSFSEAARRLGHKSRSGLYRLKADGRLDPYLVDGPDGGQLVELTPAGKPTLETYLAAVLDPSRGPRSNRREQRAQKDRRWELVAARLSASLEEIGGPSLTAEEAELVAEKLGEATWDRFPEGLPRKDISFPGPGRDSVMENLWNPLAADVLCDLVASGWKLPALSGAEVLMVYRWADTWMEGTTWDVESVAWWQEAMEDTTPGDPSPDPWRCQWCGKPWHHSHPEYERPPAVEAFWKKELARLGLGTSQDIPEEVSEDTVEPDPA